MGPFYHWGKRGIRLLTTIITCAFILPLVSSNVDKFAQDRQYDTYLTSAWVPITSWLSQWAEIKWFWFLLGFFSGITTLFWSIKFISEKYANKEEVSLPIIGYEETKIRLVREEGSKYNFLEAELSNIYCWQQVFSHVAAEGESPVILHNDNFFFIFEKPIEYGRPKLNSFGYEFPMYNFWGTTNRGAVLQVNGWISAPVFEIIFPKPSKYLSNN